jgi:N-acetylglucosaminyldiphosphoundecaprenol N-acetyl-beta-D-mannosaminyltransferase
MKLCIEKCWDETSGSGETVRFDDLEVWRRGTRRFVEELVGRAKAKEKTLACYLNAHTYHLACQDEDYRSILSRAEILYPDGMSIVWAVKLLSGVRVERMTGVDFFESFIQLAKEQGVKLYFLGSRPGVADLAAQFLREKHPGIQIVGTHHGYLAETAQVDRVLTDIQASGADIVLVGMGSPGQETFVARHGEAMGVPVVWTIGALFDYYAGEEKAAPRWMGRAGLEWLYRLYRDPKGKWRRYIIGNCWFAGRVIRKMLGI